MTREDIEKYKELLTKERAEIMKDLAEGDDTAKDLLEKEMQTVGDSADEASLSVTQNMLNVTNTKNKQTLVSIEAALRRIEEGLFGNCVSCGKEIGKERLDALPWATMCIKCKNENEKHK